MSQKFHKSVRRFSIYFLIFSGVILLLWFLLVIISLSFDPSYYSGEMFELLSFSVTIGGILIMIPLVINLILNIELVSNVSTRKTVLSSIISKKESYFLGVTVFFMFVLFATGIISHINYLRKEKEYFKVLIDDLMQDHHETFEEISANLQKSSNLLTTKGALEKIWFKHPQVSLVDLVFQYENPARNQYGLIDFQTPDSLLVRGISKELLFTLLPEEKDLISEMISRDDHSSNILELSDGKLRGYYLLNMEKEKVIVRFHPRYDYIVLKR